MHNNGSENIKVLIIGSDANAYYMARCTYEAYGIKAHLIAKKPWFFTNFSKIFTIEYVDNLWDEDTFVSSVNNYAKKNSFSKILLVGTNDTYTEYIAKNSEIFEPNLYFSKKSFKVVNSMMNKERFYQEYADSSLDFPKTAFFNITDKDLPKIDFPIIIKPANPVTFNHVDFKDKKKIYRIYRQDQLEECLSNIADSDYKDALIMQEYIEGDDTHMFDSVVYIDSNHNVTLQSFAQVGLQDQSAQAIGNITCLINNFCSFENAPVEECKKSIRDFFENIDYNGFANVDIKYDLKHNKFKILEINARQGRGSYYVSAAGYNLIQTMAEDLIFNKTNQFVDIQKNQMLSYVPKSIWKKHIKNKAFLKMAQSCWKNCVNPVFYWKDMSFKRFLAIKKSHVNYKKNYDNPYWKP